MSEENNKQVMVREEDVSMGFGSSKSFDLMNRVAKAFSSSTLVPTTYQGSSGIANCLIALNMSTRMKADPLMVMQNLYVVHGRPSWSSQFLIATFNSCGRFSSLRYTFFGEEGTDSWGCFASAVEKESGIELKGSKITLKLAKDEGWSTKSGSKWKNLPQQMLMYRAAAWFIRAYAPEIAMGLQTKEELDDISKPIDITPKSANPDLSQLNEIMKSIKIPDDGDVIDVESNVIIKESDDVTQEQFLKDLEYTDNLLKK